MLTRRLPTRQPDDQSLTASSCLRREPADGRHHWSQWGPRQGPAWPLAQRGARLIALTTCEEPLDLSNALGHPIPLRQVCWQAGREAELEAVLEEVDVLVINHGVNLRAQRSAAAAEISLEVNAFSGWRLMELFAAVVRERQATGSRPRPRCG